MLSKIHKPAAAIGFLCIATFFSATVLSELFGSHETVAAIKKLILFPGLLILIPALAATGASGFKLAKNRKGRLLEQKKKRMPFIAANGLLILVPWPLSSAHGHLKENSTPLFTPCKRLS